MANVLELRQDEVVRSIYLLGTRAELFDDVAPAETHAHQSNGPYQRIGLRHPLCALQPYAAHRRKGRDLVKIVYC
jgi:hypothetical protein